MEISSHLKSLFSCAFSLFCIAVLYAGIWSDQNWIPYSQSVCIFSVIIIHQLWWLMWVRQKPMKTEKQKSKPLCEKYCFYINCGFPLFIVTIFYSIIIATKVHFHGHLTFRHWKDLWAIIIFTRQNAHNKIQRTKITWQIEMYAVKVGVWAHPCFWSKILRWNISAKFNKLRDS